MVQWFEDNEQYTVETPIPEEFQYGRLSLVRVYPNGKTQPGWGAKDFVTNQEKGLFEKEKALEFYEKYRQPFAFVMRSVPLLCVDIDGKNDGIVTARVMNLPRTLAETSKSGNGYHLYYRMPYTNYGERGFDELPDITGLLPGVDIKATGVVFHYPNQRWNNSGIEMIPPTLMELLGRIKSMRWSARVTKEGTSNMDPDELVIVHDLIKHDLYGKFELGNRNNKLYAIGAQMYATGYPAWDTALYDRGLEIGLEMSELSEMIRNIEKYV